MKPVAHIRFFKGFLLIFLVTAIAVIGTSSALTWQIETVKTSFVLPSSLVLDNAGNPRISYADTAINHLTYAWNDGAGWRNETVDVLFPGSGYGDVSLALDAAGNPRIGYLNRTGTGYDPATEVKYAWKDGAGWHIERVEPTKWRALSVALALDSAGNPRITYYDEYDTALTYAWRDGAGWHTETAASVGMMMGDTFTGDVSMALDPTGNPRITYNNRTANERKYAWRDGAGWHTETMSLNGNGMSLALDSAGNPRVSYIANDFLAYGWRDGAGWQSETVASSSSYGQGATFLRLDAASTPRIVYTEDNEIKFAERDGASWRILEVDSGDRFFDLSMALDGAGTPRIGYYGADNSNLKYAVRTGPGWRTERVDGVEQDFLDSISLALDADGNPRVSYWYLTDSYYYDYLKYSWKDSAGWHNETADAADGVGEYSSLALDGTGNPRISYYDRTNEDLKYSWKDGTGWHNETVDTAGRVGFYTSLVLDGAGNPCISYGDGNTDDLKYAWKDGAGWHTETVDAEGEGATSTSLALDGAGNPRISYGNSDIYGGSALKYARRDATGWHTETVDNSSWNVGGYSSLALDAAGNPCISYNYLDNVSRIALKYAWRDGDGWQIEMVDSQAAAISSLALDSAGNPHIAFSGGEHVRYAERDSTGWHSEAVDPTYYFAGATVSLVMDAAGKPRISYYEDTNNFLRYAWIGESALVVPTLPGGASAPTDTNADGKYDDVNGNGRADFADVVLYFNQMSWISGNEPVGLFDFNGNGRIDFADVVWLFNHL